MPSLEGLEFFFGRVREDLVKTGPGVHLSLCNPRENNAITSADAFRISRPHVGQKTGAVTGCAKAWGGQRL